MKAYIIILTVLILSNCSNKQNGKASYEMDTQFNEYFSRISSRGEFSNVYGRCEKGVILFYFKIKDGKAYDIEYSKGASTTLSNRFLKILNSFDWNSKALYSENVFLIPYVYNFQTGCGVSMEVDSLTSKSKAKRQEVGDLYNLFKEEPIDVILLRPIRESTLE